MDVVNIHIVNMDVNKLVQLLELVQLVQLMPVQLVQLVQLMPVQLVQLVQLMPVQLVQLYLCSCFFLLILCFSLVKYCIYCYFTIYY